MRDARYFIGSAATCALLLMLAFGSGCGNDPLLGAAPPDVKLVAYAGSDWQAGDLALKLDRVPGGWELGLTSTTASPAQSLLCELSLPVGYRAMQAELMVPNPELSLVVTSAPGLVAVGVVMPAGGNIQPGLLLRAKVVADPSAQKAVAKVPVGIAGQVPDLTGVEDGVGGWQLTWGYYNRGDYCQDSETNISDLTPLAGRLYQSTTDGNRDGLDKVLDGDNNGEVNAADLTPLGANYKSVVNGYRIYRADGPDLETANIALVKELAFDESTLPVDARRFFSTLLSGADVVAEAYYFVRPFDLASGEEGPASNVLQFLMTINLKFHVPPAGNNIIDSAQCQNPSLVLMPAITGISEAGAPVIVYSTLGGGGGVTPLKIAYYNGDNWVTQEIGGGDNWGAAEALWLPDPAGSGPGSGLVVGYDINALKVVDRRFNEQWEQTGGSDVGAASGAVTQLALDRDATSGALGVAYGVTGVGSGDITYGYTDESGAWNTQPVASVTDTIGGLDFRFDPNGGAPWILYTHGTVNTGSGLLTTAFVMEQARREGGTWTTSAIPYPDSPLAVDLGFRGDGTPQLACTAARNFTVNFIPGVDPFTVSLLFDVVTGEYNGSAWTLDQAYESSFGISLGGFPFDTLVLDLALASDVGWAQADELLLTQSGGSITISITDYTPQDGALSSSSEFMQRQAGGLYSEAGYYDGDAGRSYSWVKDAAGAPVCAYIRSTSMTAQDALAGNFNAAGELSFWSP